MSQLIIVGLAILVFWFILNLATFCVILVSLIMRHSRRRNPKRKVDQDD